MGTVQDEVPIGHNKSSSSKRWKTIAFAVVAIVLILILLTTISADLSLNLNINQRGKKTQEESLPQTGQEDWVRKSGDTITGDLVMLNADFNLGGNTIVTAAGEIESEEIDILDEGIDASEISGEFGDSLFSAWGDLTTEGYVSNNLLGTTYFDSYQDLSESGRLDNNSDSDLLIRSQSDSRFVNEGQLDSIVSSMILDGTISTSDLADSAVTTVKLADGSVTTAKILDGSITSGKIADGTIVSIDIADSAVITAKVDDGAITEVKLADGSVSLSKLSTAMCAVGEILKKTGPATWSCSADIMGGGVNSVTAGNGLSNSGTANDPILDVNVDGTSIEIVTDTLQIRDGGVTNAKLADNSVTVAKIQDGTVTNGKIANATEFVNVQNSSGVSQFSIVNNSRAFQFASSGALSLNFDGVNHRVTYGLNTGPGSGLNADLLDGQEGSYYTNASNINAGTLGTSYFSAYSDLTAEGYLDNDSDSDILIRSQADTRFINDGAGEINNSNDFNFSASTFISNLDADLLDGLDSTSFMSVSTDNWVDEAGDTMNGNLIMNNSNIIPAVDSTGTIGSPLAYFSAIYVDEIYTSGSSLYMNGNLVLESQAASLNFTADLNQSLQTQTSGSGNLQFTTNGSGNIQFTTNSTGDITLNSNDTIQSSSVGSTTIQATGLNANVTINASGVNSQVQLAATDEIDLTAPIVDINGNLSVSGNISDATWLGNTIGTGYFSAYSDLTAEGYLNNDAGTDLLTRNQSDARYLIFTTFDAPSGTDPVADSYNDTITFSAGSNITITGDATSDTITIASTGGDSYNYWTASDNDDDSYTVTSLDTLKFAEGSGIDVNFTGDDLLTFTNTGDLSTTNELQNLWATFNADSGTTSANSLTDTLTVSGGGIVTTSIVGDTLTITGTEADNLAAVSGRGATTTDQLSFNYNAGSPFTVLNSTVVTNLNADLLDGQEGSYYTNASNINAGTLGTGYFSAYSDLTAEAYLDNDADTDILIRSQSDARYLSFRTFSAPSGTNPVADLYNDTLTFAAGSNITITGDATSDTITFAVNSSGLNADTLDTLDSISFLRSDASDSYDAGNTLTFAGATDFNGDITISDQTILFDAATFSALDLTGDLRILASGDDDDYIYFNTATDAPSILWEGVLAYANDPGFRINTTSGEVEYRDEDEGTWTSLDSLAGGASLWTDLGSELTPTGGESIQLGDTDWIGIGSAAERIIFDDPGDDISIMNANVGIGTTEPLGRLHVDWGNMYIGGEEDVDRRLWFIRNDLQVGYISTGISAPVFSIGSQNNYDLELLNDSGNGITIKDSGYVGIGTTNPLDGLDVSKNWWDSSATDWGGGIKIHGTAPSISFWDSDQTAQNFMIHTNSNALNFYVRPSGGSFSQMAYFNAASQLTLNAALAANGGISIDGNTVIDDGGGWHRSYGATGWYNGTYGGGMYMTDTSWVRAYNGKGIWADGEISTGGNYVMRTFNSASGPPTRDADGEFGVVHVAGVYVRLYARANGLNFYIDRSGNGDYSEYFLKQNPDQTFEFGSIVNLDNGRVNLANKNTSPLGVVSAFGSQNNNTEDGERYKDKRYVNVGLIGQLPAIVSSENGSIEKGDPISSYKSDYPGVGTKHDPQQTGHIIGKAIQPFIPNDSLCPQVNSFEEIPWPQALYNDNPENLCFKLPNGIYVGKIMAFVNVSWYEPESYLNKLDQIISDYNKGLLGNSGNIDTLSNLTITNSLTADSIQAQNGTFANINVGNMTVTGNLNVTGLLTAHQIKTGILQSFDSKNLVIKLSEDLGNTALEIQNSLGETVFSVDSQGKISIKSDSKNASVGTSTFDVGETEVSIETSAVKDNSNVFVTPVSDSEDPPLLWVKEIGNGYFVVKMDKPKDEKVKFSWWVIN